MASPCEYAKADRPPETIDDQVSEFEFTTGWKNTYLFYSSQPFNPVFPGNHFDITTPPDAAQPVNITVESIADLSSTGKYAAVYINRHLTFQDQIFLGNFHQNTLAVQCPAVSKDTAIISPEEWNQAIVDAGGSPVITVEWKNTTNVCGSGGNTNKARVLITYNQGGVVSTPVNARLWTEDLRAKVLLAKATVIPVSHQSAMPVGWSPGYAVHYAMRPVRRVEELDVIEATQWFYARRVVGADGYARLEYESVPAGEGFAADFRQSHFARAFANNFDASDPDPPAGYGEAIKDIVPYGYSARLGVVHTPYWGEAIYHSAATICSSATP